MSEAQLPGARVEGICCVGGSTLSCSDIGEASGQTYMSLICLYYMACSKIYQTMFNNESEADFK